MEDRSLLVTIALSIACHVLLAGAFALASSFAAPVPTATIRPAESMSIAVRLVGSKTRLVETAPNRSASREPNNPPSLRSDSEPPPASTPPVRTAPAADKEVHEPASESPPRETSDAADARIVAAVTDVDDGNAVPSQPSAEPVPERATGAGGDTEDAFARYVESVRSRIHARKHYPSLARKRAVEGRVIARVAISVDGRIESIEFHAGAPPLLRHATNDAIRSAAPYPAPPDGPVTIEFPIDYSLRDTS